MPAKTARLAPSVPLGERILHYRTKAGLTQLCVAHRIGYTGEDAGSYISRVESGSMEPRLRTLRKIAEALGVKLELLTK